MEVHAWPSMLLSEVLMRRSSGRISLALPPTSCASEKGVPTRMHNDLRGWSSAKAGNQVLAQGAEVRTVPGDTSSSTICSMRALSGRLASASTSRTALSEVCMNQEAAVSVIVNTAAHR